MATEVLMPALSPTMTEGNLSKWLKKEGDKVSPGDIIAEIETDKATMEVECIDEGVLGKIVVPESTPDVKVNQLIAVLIEDGEGDEEIKKLIDSHDTSFVQPKPNDHPTQQVKEVGTSATGAAAATSGKGRVKASPLAKRIANDMQIDIKKVSGSGPHGRVVKRDVENFAPAAAMATHGTAGNISGFVHTGGATQENRVVPLTQVQKVVAGRLSECKQTVPHFYITSQCRVDTLFEVRKQLNKELEPEGVKISVNDMIIKACARALMDVPEANSAWNDDSIIQFGSVDISIAVATKDGGLITPIVFGADQMGLVEVSETVKRLVQKANDNVLAPHEFQGGGFSISNLGMYDVDEFKAIINPPQSCILAVGSATNKPCVGDDGSIEPGMVLKLSLSCDHRVVDGRIGAILLKKIKLYLQKPYMLLK